MGGVALSLVLLSACGHALWNFHLKRSVDKLTFMWWVMVISGLFLTALWLPFRAGWGSIPLQGWACLVGSGLVHGGYLASLTRAYDEGDLSYVYPLVRSAPVFLILWAILFLGERFTPRGLTGIAVVMGGVYLIQVGEVSASGIFAPLLALGKKPAQLALLGALLLSFGSLIDKVGVTVVHPFLYAVLFIDLEALIFTALLIGRRSLRDLFIGWFRNRRRLLVAGTVGVPSYALVLLAMSLSQVSYVIAARQISVVLGVLLGIWLLGERHQKIRFVASVLICAGVVVIGLA